jgi:sirohydrochlorin ferrochelatase
MTGYIIFAHGSSIESANDAVRAAALEMARRGELENVVAAFLGGGKPDLQDAAIQLAEHGVRRIIVIPYFLTLGLHLQRDLPKLIDGARAQNPGVEFEVTPPLDGHPAMVDALLDRARAPYASQTH